MRFLIQIVLAWVVAYWLLSRLPIQTSWSTTPSLQQQDQPTLPSDIELWWLETQLVESVAMTEPSVVSILASREIEQYQQSPFGGFFGLTPNSNWSDTVLRQVWWGSWVLINNDWYILTNRHVVEDEDLTYEAVFADWRILSVTNIWQDPVIDLAIVKVEPDDNLPSPARFAPRNRSVALWQFTYAIGNALAEYQNSVTLGIISGKDRKIQTMSQDLYVWLYQTDTSISMGNSWWPLYTLDWSVIWINTAVSAVGENIGFAIPVSEELIQATLATIDQNWSVVRPFVWVQYIDINPLLAAQRDLDVMQWVSIEDIVSWSGADQGWLQSWDIITAINWLPINEDTPFLYQLFSYVPWESINVTFIRDWFERTTQIELGRQ